MMTSKRNDHQPAVHQCPVCHQPQINDIGVFGVVRDRDGKQQRGVGILAGGGLSSTP